MQFSKGVGIFLIVCTILFFVQYIFGVGFFAGWKTNDYVDRNYVVYDRQPNGDVRVQNGNQMVVIPAPQPIPAYPVWTAPQAQVQSAPAPQTPPPTQNQVAPPCGTNQPGCGQQGGGWSTYAPSNP